MSENEIKRILDMMDETLEKLLALSGSLLKKDSTSDNVASDSFFGRLEDEMFYSRAWEGVSIEEFIIMLEDYTILHNGKRIKISLGGMSPWECMQNLGLAF